MAGIQGGMPLGNYGNVNRGQFDLMRSAEATDTRINFRLGTYYADWTTLGADGTTALDQYDLIINTTLDRGMRVLGLLSNEAWQGHQADWTANHAGSGDNPYLRGFAQAASLLMKHFAGRIETWEIWNEPDAWTIAPGQGGSFIYPSNFVALLRNVHAVTPAGITLVSGGLFVNDISATNIYSATYMNEVWSLLGSERPFDVVGIHLYISNANQVLAYANAVDQRGLPRMVTEIGWSTDTVTYAQQAANLTTAYRLLGSPNMVYWFSIQDGGAGKYGIYDIAGNPKPAVAAFKGVGAMNKQFDDVWAQSPVHAPSNTGIAQAVKATFLTGKISACFATTLEFSTVDWQGTPIQFQYLSNGLHAEYNTVTHVVHIYDARNGMVA